MKFIPAFFFLVFQLLDQMAFCAEHKAAPKQERPAEETAEEGRLPGPGYRSMSLEFDSGRVSYLSPSDSVDVIAVMDESQVPAKGGAYAVTLLKMVRVLAAEPSYSSAGKSIVQFALNPNEAQYLELASRSGEIWLSLRKKGDVEDAPMQAASWNEFLSPGVAPVSRAGVPGSSAEASFVKAAGPPAWGSAGRTAVLNAVQGRMRGEAYVALCFPAASDKVRFVRAGDRIDILATLDVNEAGQQRAQKTTLTLLQNIRVLDVRKSDLHPGQSLILLEMNFKEAQYAALAWNSAEVQVSLRDSKDAETHPMEPASLRNPFH